MLLDVRPLDYENPSNRYKGTLVKAYGYVVICKPIQIIWRCLKSSKSISTPNPTSFVTWYPTNFLSRLETSSSSLQNQVRSLVTKQLSNLGICHFASVFFHQISLSRTSGVQISRCLAILRSCTLTFSCSICAAEVSSAIRSYETHKWQQEKHIKVMFEVVFFLPENTSEWFSCACLSSPGRPLLNEACHPWLCHAPLQATLPSILAPGHPSGVPKIVKGKMYNCISEGEGGYQLDIAKEWNISWNMLKKR